MPALFISFGKTIGNILTPTNMPQILLDGIQALQLMQGFYLIVTILVIFIFINKIYDYTTAIYSTILMFSIIFVAFFRFITPSRDNLLL